MNLKALVIELDEVIEKLKMKLMFYQTENANLKTKIKELKEYVLRLNE